MKSCYLLLIFICIFFVSCGVITPANPKLHKINIGKVEKLSDVYKYKCEKIVFLSGAEQQANINLFCKSVKIQKYYENFDILMLFVDENENAIGYPLHIYYNDKIYLEVPFQQVQKDENVLVERIDKNYFGIKLLE
ncbi:MAG: hypothetical protein J6X78_00845 [Treponema sp.]|nr:hypothetical protein [Treponema sp.]